MGMKSMTSKDSSWGPMNVVTSTFAFEGNGRVQDYVGGYDDWLAGDRVMLTTESGEGFMFNEDRRTEVDVFLYNASETGDEEE